VGRLYGILRNEDEPFEHALLAERGQTSKVTGHDLSCGFGFDRHCGPKKEVHFVLMARPPVRERIVPTPIVQSITSARVPRCSRTRKLFPVARGPNRKIDLRESRSGRLSSRRKSGMAIGDYPDKQQ
jgi:hypothetical protein